MVLLEVSTSVNHLHIISTVRSLINYGDVVMVSVVLQMCCVGLVNAQWVNVLLRAFVVWKINRIVRLEVGVLLHRLKDVPDVRIQVLAEGPY